MSQGAGRDTSLRHQVAVLRRRWPVVAVLAVLGCATAFLLTVLQAPVYRATSSVLLQPSNAEQLLGDGSGSFRGNDNKADTEIEVMRSQVVRDAVRAKLGRNPEVDIEARGLTNVLDIRSTSTNPAAAATEATTFAEVYVDLRRTQRVDDLLKTGELIQTQIVDLDKKIDQLEKPLRDLDARLGGAVDTNLRTQLQQQRGAAADAISAERRTLEARRSSFDDQLNRLQLVKGLGVSGGVQVVSRADQPTTPISASPLRNGALGLVGGLVLGLALAFALDQFDDRLRDKATLEAESQLPTLGVIPRLPQRKGEPLREVVTISEHTSAAAEAYRTLRTSVKFLTMEDGCRVFQITSATASEGKTLTAMNLAVALTQAGDRTIVVGCDLRRPRLDTLAHAHAGPGLTSVLVGDAELDEAIERHEEVDLAIMRTGPIPTDPSELLSSPRTAALIQALRGAYDAVILDCPPLLPVSDSLILAGYSDATLVVVNEGKTSRRNLARALELLRQVNAPVRGTVLNGTKSAGSYGYGYGYGYAYTQTPSAKGRKSRAGDNGSPPAPPRDPTVLAPR